MTLYGNGEMPKGREVGTDPLYEDLGGPEQSATVSFGLEQAYLSDPHCSASARPTSLSPETV